MLDVCGELFLKREILLNSIRVAEKYIEIVRKKRVTGTLDGLSFSMASFYYSV